MTDCLKVVDTRRLLISGIDAEDVAPQAALRANFWTAPNVLNGLRNPYSVALPVVAVAPTAYHPYVSQVTIFVPTDGRGNGGDLEYGSFELQLRSKSGAPIPAWTFYAYLRY